MNGKQYVDKSGVRYLVIEEFWTDFEGVDGYRYRVVNLSNAILLDAEISVPRFTPGGEVILLELLKMIEEIEIVEEIKRFS
jgi:hypothetical protein